MTTSQETATSKLYGWAHPDEMRAYRQQHKSMVKRDKLTTIDEAVSRGVKAGDYVVFGGMGSVRNPLAAVHEIIRQKVGDLTIGTKGSSA